MALFKHYSRVHQMQLQQCYSAKPFHSLYKNDTKSTFIHWWLVKSGRNSLTHHTPTPTPTPPSQHLKMADAFKSLKTET